MKVLIAIDGSSFSWAAVDAVASRPWTEDTEFMVLSVVPEILDPDCHYLPPVAKALDGMITRHVELVARAVSHLESKLPGKRATGKVAEGNVCNEILRASEQWAADLLVVGSHGRTGLKRFLLGSIAETVVRLAPCSVELIRVRQPEKAVLSEDCGVTPYVSF